MRSIKRAGIGLIAVGCVLAASAALGQQAEQDKGQPQMQLPEGWTEADMQACVTAGMPGPMHEHLARDAGEWEGVTTMWMGPGAEPVTSTCTSTYTTIMDGRYVKCQTKGEMPGMGMFNGLGIYGYDNVSQKFVSTWIDNHGTGIGVGTGELSGDGKTITWTFTFNCPINKKPVTMREVETRTGPDTKTLEMFGADPKTGKEYQVMKIEYTRKGASAARSAG